MYYNWRHCSLVTLEKFCDQSLLILVLFNNLACDHWWHSVFRRSVFFQGAQKFLVMRQNGKTRWRINSTGCHPIHLTAWPLQTNKQTSEQTNKKQKGFCFKKPRLFFPLVYLPFGDTLPEMKTEALQTLGGGHIDTVHLPLPSISIRVNASSTWSNREVFHPSTI